MRHLSLSGLLLLLGWVAPLAPAQERAPEPRLRCDTVSAGGTIRGVLLDDSTREPITGRPVYLKSAGCPVLTDSLGHFEIHPIPPGQYKVAVADGDYRRFQPFAVEVRADSVVELDLHLRPENLVADCLDIERCASLLDGGPGLAEELTEAERMEEAAWRTSIALAGTSWDSDWVPCADLANERVRRVLKARIPALAPTSECKVAEPGTGRPRLIHQASGTPARLVKLMWIEETTGGAVMKGSYYAGPRWAGGWTCRLSREDGDWTARWCGVDWIS